MNLDKHHHVSLFWHQQTDTVFLIFHVHHQHLRRIYAVIDRTRKQTLLIKLFDFVFTKDLPSISQSNVQAVKAEKEE